MSEEMNNSNQLLKESDLENVSGGPEERTVLGLASAVNCRKCKHCGKLIEDDAMEFCPVCGEKIS